MADPSGRYRIVHRTNAETCAALNWAWMSVRPYVVATRPTLEAARSLVRDLGTEDFCIYDVWEQRALYTDGGLL